MTRTGKTAFLALLLATAMAAAPTLSYAQGGGGGSGGGGSGGGGGGSGGGGNGGGGNGGGGNSGGGGSSSGGGSSGSATSGGGANKTDENASYSGSSPATTAGPEVCPAGTKRTGSGQCS